LGSQNLKSTSVMKTLLIKKSLSGVFVILLVIFTLLNLSGQGVDILEGGSMGANDEAFDS
jgi:hypothetical protein